MSGPRQDPDKEKKETAAEAAARLAQANQEETGTRSAAENQALRDWLRSIGIPMPATTEDLMNVGAELQRQLQTLDNLGRTMDSMPFGTGVAFRPIYNTLKGRAQGLADTLMAFAGEKFGTQGEKAISYLLRPSEPSVQKLPTPEEFLSDYQTAFASHIEGLRANKQISNEAATFATNELQSRYLEKYTARLAEFAKAGVSPYELSEISREQRGVGAGTPAGEALDKALGPGVTEPTTITGLSADVAKQAQDIGTGVGREFTSQVRIKPLDFLLENMTPSSIELAYAGSQYGAGKSSRPAPAGWASGSRRA